MDDKTQMCIAMPISSFLPNAGGMEVGIHNIATRLKAMGHRPILIVPFSNLRYLKVHGVKLGYEIVGYWPKMSSLSFKYPALAVWVYALYYRWIALKYNIDVWHATMAYPEGVGLAKAFGSNKPILMRSAGADIQINESADYGMRRDLRIDSLIRKFIPRLRAFVAITETVCDEYRALGLDESKIHIIPNGVDVKRFRSHIQNANIRLEYNIGSDCFLFLSVGRNHPKKNFRIFLEVAKKLSVLDRKFKIILVGAGVSSLKDEIDALNLGEYFLLIEQVGLKNQDYNLPHKKLLDLYTSADVFVFPSLIETFGIAIIEAMAAGLPCIVSDAPGCRSVTNNGEFALSFDPMNYDSLADLMDRIMSDSNLRELYKEKSLVRSAQYDWDDIVRQYEFLYKGLLRPLKEFA